MDCMHIGCRSKATHAVKVVVPDRYSEEIASEGLLGVNLCGFHIEAAAGWDLSGLKVFAGTLRAICEFGTDPDVDEAFIEAVPIGSMEHQAFLNGFGPVPN